MVQNTDMYIQSTKDMVAQVEKAQQCVDKKGI